MWQASSAYWLTQRHYGPILLRVLSRCRTGDFLRAPTEVVDRGCASLPKLAALERDSESFLVTQAVIWNFRALSRY